MILFNWIQKVCINTVGIGSLKLRIKLDFIENKLIILTGRNPVLVFGINLNFIFLVSSPFPSQLYYKYIPNENGKDIVNKKDRHLK